jgi:hypothetical protein
MAERFDDLPVLAELGGALEAAFAAHEAPARARSSRLVIGERWRSIPVLVLLALGIGAAAAAAALLALRLTVIPAPTVRDLPPAMRSVLGTGQVSALRAEDPDDAPPWTLRTTRSETGLTCSTVGQVMRGQFGIVGLDGRFRLLPERLVDGCGTSAPDRATLVGVRTFDADRQRDVRTVLSGVAGRTLRSAQLQTVTGHRPLPIDSAGRFVVALRGYPEDSAPAITLRFADGRTERRQFGRIPGVVRDAAGGPALQTEALRYSVNPSFCLRVIGLRGGQDGPIGPFACTRRHKGTVLFATRRLRTGQTGQLGFTYHWGTAPGRTLAWGWTQQRSRITLLGAGAPRPLQVNEDGTFLAILPSATDPAALSIKVVAQGDAVARTLPPGSGQIKTPPVPG